MMPTTISQAGTGTSIPIVLDWRMTNGVAFVVKVTGTVNYTVQHTFDNIYNVPSSSVTWMNCDDTNMVAQTATTDSVYTQSPFANRLIVNSGAGTATLIDIVQGRWG